MSTKEYYKELRDRRSIKGLCIECNELCHNSSIRCEKHNFLHAKRMKLGREKRANFRNLQKMSEAQSIKKT